MSEPDLKTVIASFADAFPGAALFLINEGDVLLVGGPPAGPSFDGAALARRMGRGRVAEDLKDVHVESPFAFASLLTLPGEALARYAASAERHTDDRPVLDSRTARSIHANTGRENAERLIAEGRRATLPEPWAALVRSPTAAQLVERATMLERSEGFSWAYSVYGDALEMEPRSLPALEGLVRCALRSGHAAEAESKLSALAEGPAPVDARVALALLYDNTGRTKDALAALEAALSRDPRHRRALLLSAELQEQTGNLEAIAVLASAALRAHPGDAEAEAFLASASLAKGDLDAAIAAADRVLERTPAEVRALEVGAIARAQKGDRDAARGLFQRLVEADPGAWGHLNNFALFELQSGNPRAAARLFEASLDLNPGNDAGSRGLAEAARSLGDDRLLARAVRIRSLKPQH
jgi:tetratricopeptide (TPR) repeat protein